jgi:hypothetical protein
MPLGETPRPGDARVEVRERVRVVRGGHHAAQSRSWPAVRGPRPSVA